MRMPYLELKGEMAKRDVTIEAIAQLLQIRNKRF